MVGMKVKEFDPSSNVCTGPTDDVSSLVSTRKISSLPRVRVARKSSPFKTFCKFKTPLVPMSLVLLTTCSSILAAAAEEEEEEEEEEEGGEEIW